MRSVFDGGVGCIRLGMSDKSMERGGDARDERRDMVTLKEVGRAIAVAAMC